MKLAFSISEACRILSIGRTTLYSAINDGSLEASKIGRRTIVTSEALSKFIQSLPSSHDLRASKQLNKSASIGDFT